MMYRWRRRGAHAACERHRFSVVQNTTLGRIAAGMRRDCGTHKPSITGMFNRGGSPGQGALQPERLLASSAE